MRTSVAPVKDLTPASSTVGASRQASGHRSDAFVLALALLELGLLSWAFTYGAREVRDGAGTVTTGYNVALSLTVTVLAAYVVERLHLPVSLRRQGQIALLGGQALHALGHLARWYYVIPGYDDILHFGVVCVTSFLLLRLAQAWNLFPEAHATPLRASLLTFVLALAAAGVWEIFEFSMDSLQGTREQDDLVDTMADMVDGLFGGVAAAAIAWRWPRASRP